MVRPGRVVVTSAGRQRRRFLFHGVTMGLLGDDWVLPSRDLIAEIMASCFYHADTLNVRSIAFPLLGTGVGGFSPRLPRHDVPIPRADVPPRPDLRPGGPDRHLPAGVALRWMPRGPGT